MKHTPKPTIVFWNQFSGFFTSTTVWFSLSCLSNSAIRSLYSLSFW